MTRRPGRRWMRHAHAPFLTASPPVTRARPPWSSGPGSPRPRPARPARVSVPTSPCAGRCPPTARSPASCAGGRPHRAGPRPHGQGRRDRAAARTASTTTGSSSGSVRSAVGRTGTAPAATSSPPNLRLGVVSCANLQAGWFSAYRHLADRNDLHAVLHLGDYIYEYGPGEYGYGQGDARHPPARARPRDPRRWRTTGSGTRSTSATPTSSGCTRSTPSSRPGTTTSPPTTPARTAPTTTTPARAAGRRGARPPTRRTTSGCRSG